MYFSLASLPPPVVSVAQVKQRLLVTATYLAVPPPAQPAKLYAGREHGL